VVVVALNVAVVAAACTVTDPGTLSVALLDESPTVMPPATATFDRVTVQVVEALGPMLAGTQETTETLGGPRSPTLLVMVVLFSVAEIVAL